MNENTLLTVHDAQFSYTKNTVAVDTVNLLVRPGEIVGLVGPNGSGKSTLIKLIFDLLELRSGAITVNGHNHRTDKARLSSIYLPSDDNLPEFLTGLEYLRIVTDLYRQSSHIDEAAITVMFRRFGMNGREKNLIEDYSHGMRKKTQLISAFLLALPLTVIDETLNGIDLDALRECKHFLKQLQTPEHGVLLCTHDFSFLEEVANRMIILDGGGVIDEIDVKDCLNTNKNLSHYVNKILL